MAHTSMLHVRVDDKLKAEATEKLASFGLTMSDAVRILLTRITKEVGYRWSNDRSRSTRCLVSRQSERGFDGYATHSYA